MVTNFVVRNKLFSKIGYLLEIYKNMFPGIAVVLVRLAHHGLVVVIVDRIAPATGGATEFEHIL